MRQPEEVNLLKKLQERNVPLRVGIELTNRCNLNCIHCCLRITEANNELSLEELKNIFDQLKDEGCLNLTFTGGEPLLRNDFFELATYAREKGFGLTILSNGTMISKENIEMLKKLRPLEIRIGLFGATAKTHEAITGVPGSFKQTIRSIKLLEKYQIPFLIVMVVMKQNFSELEILKAKVKKKGWNFDYSFCVYPTVERDPRPLNYRTTQRQLVEAKRKGFINPSHFSLKAEEDLAFYNMGRTVAQISSSGKVYPFPLLRIEVGDLRKDSFHNIWTNSDNLKWLRKLKIEDFKCFRCEYRYNCRWDPGVAYLEHGDLTCSPEGICRIMKIKDKRISFYLRRFLSKVYHNS